MRRNVREKRRRLRWVKKLKRKIFWERKEGEGIGIVQIRRKVRVDIGIVQIGKGRKK